LFPFYTHTTAGEDYTPLSQELVFSSESDREQSVSNLITDDSEVEMLESFQVRLRFGPQEEEESDGILLIPNEAMVTITDNNGMSNSMMGQKLHPMILLQWQKPLYLLITRQMSQHLQCLINDMKFAFFLRKVFHVPVRVHQWVHMSMELGSQQTLTQALHIQT